MMAACIKTLRDISFNTEFFREFFSFFSVLLGFLGVVVLRGFACLFVVVWDFFPHDSVHRQC